MENFGIFINNIIRFMNVSISLWGFSFTLMDIFMFSIIAGIVAYVISNIFDY